MASVKSPGIPQCWLTFPKAVSALSGPAQAWSATSSGPRPYAAAAWLVLAFNLAVILWGAYVRATGSGAGCGAHWPLCNGVVIPRAPEVATRIEFTHRASSGVALLLVAGMAVWATRLYPRGHRVRRAAAASLGFIVVEALLGAALVLFRLVGDNPSLTRGAVGALHLANTMVLLACVALTAWWASGAPPAAWPRGRPAWLWGTALAGLVLVGASGAVAALGDTLFPGGERAAALAAGLPWGTELLLRLRIAHPFLALGVAVALGAVAVAGLRRPAGSASSPLAVAVMGLLVVQLLAGLVNVVLAAPVWLQLVHLLLADLLWIAVVLLAAAQHPAPAAVPG